MIQKSGLEPICFDKLSDILSEILYSNIYITNRNGELLGHRVIDKKCQENWGINLKEKLNFSTRCNNQLLKINETKVNVNVGSEFQIADSNPPKKYGKFTTIVPISHGSDRLGTLIIERLGQKYKESDIVIAEFSATIAGMEIVYTKANEIEKEAREKAVVQMAVRTLSFSELEAINHILDELGGNEGLLVASKVADRVGITRSVIVNALRKLESAGVIESRSLGMKGTHIRILNDKLFEELGRNR
jgi:transcriptional pleiotropic repressor